MVKNVSSKRTRDAFRSLTWGFTHRGTGFEGSNANSRGWIMRSELRIFCPIKLLRMKLYSSGVLLKFERIGDLRVAYISCIKRAVSFVSATVPSSFGVYVQTTLLVLIIMLSRYCKKF